MMKRAFNQMRVVQPILSFDTYDMRKCIACVLEGRPAGLVEVILLKALHVAIVHLLLLPRHDK